MLNRDMLLDAMSGIRNDYVAEAASALNYAEARRAAKHVKLWRTLLIAAIIITALTGTAFAAGNLINSPSQAWKVAKAEVAQWQELGLLSKSVTMDDEADMIFECPQQEGDAYWFGRIFPHRYAIASINDKYGIHMEVDTAHGEITKFSIDAYTTDYDDVIPACMTVDRFCTLLAKYWGFSGYTLGGTEDSFYGWDTQPPSGDMPLIELNEEAYLTVYFDGDQSGVPMYVQLAEYPEYIYLTAGTNHLVG